jgi:diguanylate cyclase (GGDEF)-like protein/PAS domain S-box-containing protein
MKKQTPVTGESSLRARAEEALRTPVHAFSQEQMQALKDYQLDLEKKNEELRQLQETMESSRDLYLKLYEDAPIAYLSLTQDGMIHEVNRRVEKLFGMPRHALLGRYFDCWVQVDDIDAWTGLFQRVCQDIASHGMDLHLLQGSDHLLPVHVDCVRQAEGQRLVRLVVTDLSARRVNDQRLTLAANVFTHAHEGMMVTDTAGDILEVNQAFHTITGFHREETIGRNPRFLASGLTSKATFEALWAALITDGFWKGELSNRRRSGEIYLAGQTINAIYDANGRVVQYMALFTDVTEVREQQTRLETIAHYDALTQLPNRVLLGERMQQALVHAQHSDRMVAVAYLDLDGFKAVNDTHGHAIGDRVLQAVAQRMSRALREDCTLSRLGGDEFVILITDLEQTYDTTSMLDRLLSAASQPVLMDALHLSLTASMGVTFYPQAHEVSADQLLRQADQAMYQAKVAGKNRYCYFNPEHEICLRQYNARVERILQAVHRHEFVLHYQPKVNMRTGEVLGAEALVRWQHPEEGLLAPEAFLAVVENSVLCRDLGEWVIRQALRQVNRWAKQGLHLPISVNVGGWQLQQPDFVDRLRAELEIYPGLTPGMLMIEILETTALKDMDCISETISACKALGVGFSLDDFGTGYSSLTYLKRLPVCQLKIDRTFVQGLLDDADNVSILVAITRLAKAFKREVIAEGVDSVNHGIKLLELGCELAQGYCIAWPMPADAVVEWEANWRPFSAWQNVAPLAMGTSAEGI